MSEWLKEAVLKTVERQRSVGSNPTPADFYKKIIMPSYDKSKRCKVFGNYTGCPCCVGLPTTLSITDRVLYEEQQNKFFKKVEELIKKWELSCDKYSAGPTVGSRISENWDKKKKLPYGIFANIRCVFDEQSPVRMGYCKFSLKNESTNKPKEIYSKIGGYVKIINKTLFIYPPDSDGIINYPLPEDAVLNVEDGDFIKKSELLYIY